MAATNRDLEIDVAEGRFREDLYYRLNVVQIVVPPLRERTAEIPLLTDYFVQRYARLFRRDGFTVSPVAMERLMRHQYPGNVRELENIVKRMVVLNDPLLERVPLGLRRPPRRGAATGTEPAAGSGLSEGDRARGGPGGRARGDRTGAQGDAMESRARGEAARDQLSRAALQDQGRRPGRGAQRSRPGRSSNRRRHEMLAW